MPSVSADKFPRGGGGGGEKKKKKTKKKHHKPFPGGGEAIYYIYTMYENPGLPPPPTRLPTPMDHAIKNQKLWSPSPPVNHTLLANRICNSIDKH